MVDQMLRLAQRRFPLPLVFQLHLCELWSDQLPSVSLLKEQKHRWTTGRALRESAALPDFRPPLVFSGQSVCSFMLRVLLKELAAMKLESIGRGVRR